MPKLPIKDLHPRRKALYDFICTYMQNNDNRSPSIREMSDEIHASTSIVTYHLGQLEKQGYIEKKKKISRGVSIVNDEKETIIIYRCPKCKVLCIVPGLCGECRIDLIPVNYKEV